MKNGRGASQRAGKGGAESGMKVNGEGEGEAALVPRLKGEAKAAPAINLQR